MNSQLCHCQKRIIESEREFVNSMKEFVETFVVPLHLRDTSLKRLVLGEPSIALCIKTLTDIYSASTNFFNAIEVATTGTQVAEALSLFAPSLPLFGVYITENTSALSALKKFERQSFDDMILSKPIEIYILQPVEHYGSYRENFSDIVRSASDDPEASAFADAWGTIESHFDAIDTKLEEEEANMKLLLLQSQFKGNPIIFKAKRKLLRENDITRLKEKKGKMEIRDFYAHLFNDSFIYSTSRNGLSGTVYSFWEGIDLMGATVCLSQYMGEDNYFNVTGRAKHDKVADHLFRVESRAVAMGWVDSIQSCITALEIAAAEKAAQLEMSTQMDAPVKSDNSLTSTVSLTNGMTVGSMGARGALLYSYIGSERLVGQTLEVLDQIMIKPLIAASRGMPLLAGRLVDEISSSEKLQFSKRSSILGDRLANIQAQSIKESLKNPDMQIFLHTTSHVSAQILEFATALEAMGNSCCWADDQLQIAAQFSSQAFAALTKQYESYASGHKAALRILKEDIFQQFLLDCKTRCGLGSPLPHFEGPLSGAFRALELVQRIHQNTPANHSEYSSLNDTLAALQAVVANIDDISVKKQNYEKLIEIQSSFVSMISADVVVQKLVSMERIFLLEGDLKKVCRKANKEFRFWLFNDMLIYGTPLGGGTYSFNRSIDLLKCSVVAHEPIIHAFEILGGEKSFVVIAESNAALNRWISVISDAATAFKQSKGVSTAHVAAAIWATDKSSGGCSICGVAFGFIKRRHHCRKCGCIVCDEHSAGTLVLPHIHAKKKQRVCDSCLKEGAIVTGSVADIAPSVSAEAPTEVPLSRPVSEQANPIYAPPLPPSTPAPSLAPPAPMSAAPTVKAPIPSAPVGSLAPSTVVSAAPKNDTPQPRPVKKAVLPSRRVMSMRRASATTAALQQAQTQAKLNDLAMNSISENESGESEKDASVATEPTPTEVAAIPVLDTVPSESVLTTPATVSDNSEEVSVPVAASPVTVTPLVPPVEVAPPSAPPKLDLMASIAKGTTLKSIERSSSPPASSLTAAAPTVGGMPPRPNLSFLGDIGPGNSTTLKKSTPVKSKPVPVASPKLSFLADIQGGTKRLKAVGVVERPEKEVPKAGGMSLLGMLATKMNERRNFMQDDEESGSEASGWGSSSDDDD